MTEFKDIWNNLSQLNLDPYIEKKGGLSFISWSNCWSIMVANYPSATFKQLPHEVMPDGVSIEVNVQVTVEGHVREMWLPVMDFKNKAIINPSAREISDAKMRCLVKCCSLFGLGLYLYQGEDLPRKPELGPEAMVPVKAAVKMILEYINGEFTDDEKMSSVAEVWREMSEQEQSAAWKAKTKGGFFTKAEKDFIRESLRHTKDVQK